MSPASREVIPSGLKLSRSPASVEIKGQQGTHPTGLQSTEAREEDHRRVRANGVRALGFRAFPPGIKVLSSPCRLCDLGGVLSLSEPHPPQL